MKVRGRHFCGIQENDSWFDMIFLIICSVDLVLLSGNHVMGEATEDLHWDLCSGAAVFLSPDLLPFAVLSKLPCHSQHPFSTDTLSSNILQLLVNYTRWSAGSLRKKHKKWWMNEAGIICVVGGKNMLCYEQ